VVCPTTCNNMHWQCHFAFHQDMHVKLIYRMNSLLVDILLVLLCRIMRLAFTLLPCSLLQIFGNLVNPLELPWPLIVVQELAVIKAVVISRVVFSMVCWCKSCGLVAVHRVIPAEPDMCCFWDPKCGTIGNTPCCSAIGTLLFCSSNTSSLQTPLLQRKMLTKCLYAWHLASSHVPSIQDNPKVDVLTFGQHAHRMHTVQHSIRSVYAYTL